MPSDKNLQGWAASVQAVSVSQSWSNTDKLHYREKHIELSLSRKMKQFTFGKMNKEGRSDLDLFFDLICRANRIKYKRFKKQLLQ